MTMIMQPVEFEAHFYDQLLRLIELRHHQPHAILGLHNFFEGSKVIRLWRPGAQKIDLEVFGSLAEARKIHESGIFEYVVPAHTTPYDYRIYHQSGLLAHDPYAFLPTFGEMDQHLFGRGVHYQLYQCMGGRLTHHQGVSGARFSVWAPNAKSVSVVGDFNYWDGRVNPMRALGYSGVWELFIPGLTEGEKYKFEIQTQQGERITKADPYALMCELRPATASMLTDMDNFQWQDEHWLRERQRRNIQSETHEYL